MNYSPLPSGGIALVVLLSLVPAARADLIPWTYTWSRSPTEVRADAPGTGYVQLTDEGATTTRGESDIVATNLKTFSTATDGNRDVFTAKPYSLTLTIVDTASGERGAMTFTGQIDGWLTAESSMLRNTFTSVTAGELTLGGNRYSASIGPFAQPGHPRASNTGSIVSTVTIDVQAIVQQLPEPATLVLSGVGGVLLAASRLRASHKRRAGA